jgi:hypothetical protein
MTSRWKRSTASGTTSKSTRHARRFCLDADISYKVAAALATVELPFLHVTEAIPPPPGTPRGRQPAPDPEVAKWCGQAQYVLVTIDTDFWSRWVKTGLLANCGVEVIVFNEDLKGLEAQHSRVTRHYAFWQETLGKSPYAHRVWSQTRKLEPGLIQGRKARRRSRAKPATGPERPSVRSSTAVLG